MSTSFLTDKELADLREEVLITLPDSAAIVRRTPSTDASGYPSETSATVGTYRARLDPIPQYLLAQTIGAQESQRTRFLLSLEYGADVRDGDAVTINGETLEILQIFDIHSARIVVRCAAARIGNG